MPNIFDKARAEGLIRPENAGLSAKELLAKDPALAARFADFIRDNKAELVREVAGRLEGAL